MEEPRFCCGQIPQRKKGKDAIDLPENPLIQKGAEIIYLGAGDLKIKGKKSGLMYYVSDHRRRFKAEGVDVMQILELPDFILKP